MRTECMRGYLGESHGSESTVSESSSENSRRRDSLLAGYSALAGCARLHAFPPWQVRTAEGAAGVSDLAAYL